MSLQDLDLQDEYRSDTCDLIQDFYLPCLEQSTLYSRAVGFFSSTSMAAAAQGIKALIRSGGKMRLVASPCLSAEDAAAIASGLQQREAIITQLLVTELEQKFDALVSDRLACLAWLLEHHLLDIRLAVRRNLLDGIYHEKLGIFTDAAGNQVAFTGSANESSSALMDNFECVDIYRSWFPGDASRVAKKVENFQRLWDNQTDELEILEFPEAAKRSLLKVQRRREQGTRNREQAEVKPIKIELPEIETAPKLPEGLVLRSYQRRAIDNWFGNKGRGTLKMATGSGKTITALAIATELYQQIGLQALIIVCPYRHLVHQWAKESGKFGIKPILAFETARLWQSELSHQLYNIRAGHQAFLTVITTNATLIGAAFQSQLRYFPEKTLIIGDEAHNLGSRQLEKKLPRQIGLRLALSATPERYFDEVGTEALFDYFGTVLQPEFTIADAIAQGALVHYLYYPILIELTEDETQRYAELTKKICRVKAMSEDDDHPALAALMMQRAKLLGMAANKLTALRELMSKRLQTSHTLFYCGDGSVEDDVSTESQQQVQAVARILGYELGYRVNTYTAETPLDERVDLTRQFEEGELQGLVAIRCLDEGVDIPATQTAVILASSGNPRQFIQRRGRILRPHPSKQRSTLFDMMVLPPNLERTTLNAERSLLRRELRRFLEFADLADNAAQARIELLDIQKRYNLLDM